MKNFSKRKKSVFHHHDEIQEDLIFGLDLGIASVGWAVLKNPLEGEGTASIEAMGSWCFELPEAPKTKEPLNQKRREARLHRRTLRRRRQRMDNVRALFYKNGLLPSKDKDILQEVGSLLRKKTQDRLNPWVLRVAGLERLLEPQELAIALAHIAKHRGVSFTMKEVASEKEEGGYKESIKKEGDSYALSLKEAIEGRGQLRNRRGAYLHTAHRELLKREVASIFEKQRSFGNIYATKELEEEFCKIGFFQNPLQDSDHLVGKCIFEPKEKRAAKYAPSFEKFRLLQTLNNLQIKDKKQGKIFSFIDFLEEKILNQEIPSIESLFSSLISMVGKEKSLTATELRKISKLEKSFVFLSNGKEVREIASFKGSYALYDVLGEEIWKSLSADILDKIAALITHKASEETLKEGLEKLKIPQDLKEAVIKIILQEMKEESCRFSYFKGVGHLSSKSLRKIIPHLEKGMTYDKACAQAGYDHTRTRLDNFKQIRNKQDFNDLVQEVSKEVSNPVVQKSFTEGLKQLWAMRVRYGLPSKICIELARDVGKSVRERKEIKKRQGKREKESIKEREDVAGILGKSVEAVKDQEVLRYRLWKEQQHHCLYTGKSIHPTWLGDGDKVEIDHILPLSRFWDNSFNNKALVLKNANQNKSNETALEWFERTKSEEETKAFEERVRTSNLSPFKKERLLFSKNNKNAEEYKNKMKARYLNDTRYATRIFAKSAAFLYDETNRGKSEGSKRRIFARPGGITASLRHGWGVETLKYQKNEENGKKERLDDSRHHALDALIVACCDDAMLQKMTRDLQKNADAGKRVFSHLTLPWENFREDLKEKYKNITTARPENRRARGAAHEATVKSAYHHPQKGIEVFKRVSIANLKKGELANIKDKERNPHIIKALEDWFEKGAPQTEDALPRLVHKDKKTGKIIRTDIIRSVTIRDKPSGVYLPEDKEPAPGKKKAIAVRGSITRVDVYSQITQKGANKGKKSYYLVPIYSYQIMNKRKYPIPPMFAIVAKKDEKEWIKIDKNFSFEFSLYPGSYVRVQNKDKIIEGYYLRADRINGDIKIRFFNTSKKTTKKEGCKKYWDKIGARSLEKFQKYQINRFGEKFPVKEDKITWHGKAKTLLEWLDEVENEKSSSLKNLKA